MECVACEYACEDGADQVRHYKSDWHRYNLRRRVRDMPSISFAAFEQRLEAAQQLLAEKKAEHEPDHRVFTCVICRKNFGSENATEQHMKSKKHKAVAKKHGGSDPSKFIRVEARGDAESTTSSTATTVAAAGGNAGEEGEDDVEGANPGLPQAAAGGGAGKGDDDAEGEGDEDEDLISGEEEDEEIDDLQFAGRKPIPVHSCLFCNTDSADMAANLEHMRVEHGFAVPEVQYCADVEALLSYLGEKVGLGCLCLYCAGDKNGFKSLQAAQSHMRDKQHCRVAYNDDFDRVEFEDFYDYHRVFKDGVRVPLGERLAVDHTGEAVLFDGTRIGHRLFKQVYKQRYIADDVREAVQLNKKAIADRFWSKALGLAPSGAVAPKGFHNTAKSLILYKKSKVLAVKAHTLFVRHQKNHQKSVDRFANKLTGQVQGGAFATYTMAR